MSNRETLRSIGQQRETLKKMLLKREERGIASENRLQRVADYLEPKVFLKNNPSPDYVIGDLDFSLGEINGVRIRYESLTPDSISSEGKVTRPTDRERRAGIRLTMTFGNLSEFRDLQYYVMPLDLKLPLIMVHCAGRIDRRDRTECMVQLIENDGIRRSEAIPGRVRLRGNTSVLAGKKQFSIKMDGEHDFLGLGRSRHLLLTSFYSDITFMRDRLSYDIYRSFTGRGSSRFAPSLHYVELVMNGKYRGVYGLSDRIDAVMLGFGEEHESAGQPVLYKVKHNEASFSEIRRELYVQKVPSWKKKYHWQPLEDLLSFTAYSDDHTFREEFETFFNLENIMDSQILLDFTNNADGRTCNFYLARGAEAGDRFFIVPWDYDKTFRGDGRPLNFLHKRLLATMPEYKERLRERWTELRGGILAEEAIMSRIEVMQAFLSPGAMERNYRLWKLNDGVTFDQEVAKLKIWIRDRLKKIDRRFGI